MTRREIVLSDCLKLENSIVERGVQYNKNDNLLCDDEIV